MGGGGGRDLGMAYAQVLHKYMSFFKSWIKFSSSRKIHTDPLILLLDRKEETLFFFAFKS